MVPYPQYWVGRLTGSWRTEPTSLGCHTDLWLPREARLSDLVEKLGLQGKFPALCKARDLVGTILPVVAQATGLSPSTPVFGGIHDSIASLYPRLLERQAPFSVLSTGTWVITMSVGGKPVELDPARDTLMNVNAFGEPVPSARFMGGREFEMLTRGAPATPTVDDVASVLKHGAALSPAVEPSSGPFQGRQAEWTVPETQLGGGERSAVISFYLAMMAVTCLELTGAEGPVVTEGPFARNGLFLDLVSAATGRPVLSSSGSATGTSIGAALLAADHEPTTDHATASDKDNLHPMPSGSYLDDLIRYAEHWRQRR